MQNVRLHDIFPQQQWQRWQWRQRRLWRRQRRRTQHISHVKPSGQHKQLRALWDLLPADGRITGTELPRPALLYVLTQNAFIPYKKQSVKTTFS